MTVPPNGYDPQGAPPPWPLDAYGRPWPADAYGRPVPPYPYAPPVQVPHDKPIDERVYKGAPFTLAPALEAADSGLRKPVRGIERQNGWLELAIALPILFCWVVFAVVASLVGQSLGDSDSAKSIAMLLGTLVPWIALVGGALLMSWFTGNGPVIDFGYRWRWRFLWWGLLYGVIAYVTALILGIISQMIWGDFDSAAGEVAKDAKGNTVAYTVILVSIAIGAPIVEELFFRGYILGAFAKTRIWSFASIFFSALIFGMIHFEPKRLLLLVGIGIILAIARWRTGSTITSTFAHMVNNMVGVVALLFSGSIFLL